MTSNSNQRLKLKHILTLGAVSLAVVGAIASGSVPFFDRASHTRAETPHSSDDQLKDQEEADLSQDWRLATEEEEEVQWGYILSSPMGIAALNQLAIEGFISPLCTKTFYINDQYGGFQSLMKVECPEPRGASTAVGYDEVHVTFNRFESNIESFDIERFGQS